MPSLRYARYYPDGPIEVVSAFVDVQRPVKTGCLMGVWRSQVLTGLGDEIVTGTGVYMRLRCGTE